MVLNLWLHIPKEILNYGKKLRANICFQPNTAPFHAITLHLMLIIRDKIAYQEKKKAKQHTDRKKHQQGWREERQRKGTRYTNKNKVVMRRDEENTPRSNNQNRGGTRGHSTPRESNNKICRSNKHLHDAREGWCRRERYGVGTSGVRGRDVDGEDTTW